MSLKSIWIASDHAGYELKEFFKKERPQLPWKDLGPASSDSVDYPDYAKKLVTGMAPLFKDESHEAGLLENAGVLICGSGQGMAIGANRHPLARAALCWNPEIAELSRQHNNANIVCIGSRFLKPQEALAILDRFLETPFEGGRHGNRVRKLSEIGSTGNS